MGFYVPATYFLANASLLVPIESRYAWILVSALIIGSSLFAVIPISYFFRHAERRLILGAIIVGSSNLIGLLLSVLHAPLVRLSGSLSYLSLSALFKNLSMTEAFTEKHGLFVQITSPSIYTIAIGGGCSGLDGIVLVLCVIGFLLLARGRDLPFVSQATLLLLGAGLMFLANVFRLTLLFSAMCFSLLKLGRGPTLEWVFPVLHSYLGFVICAVVLIFMYKLFLKALRNLETKVTTNSVPVLCGPDGIGE